MLPLQNLALLFLLSARAKAHHTLAVLDIFELMPRRCEPIGLKALQEWPHISAKDPWSSVSLQKEHIQLQPCDDFFCILPS